MALAPSDDPLVNVKTANLYGAYVAFSVWWAVSSEDMEREAVHHFSRLIEKQTGVSGIEIPVRVTRARGHFIFRPESDVYRVLDPDYDRMPFRG